MQESERNGQLFFYKGDMDCYTAADGTLVCPKNEGGNLDDCQRLVDAGCTYIKSECTDGAQGSSGNCYVYTNTYDCGYDQVVSTPVSERTFKCSGSVACMGTDCITTDFTQSTDFTKAAALLHVAQQASKDMTCTELTKTAMLPELKMWFAHSSADQDSNVKGCWRNSKLLRTTYQRQFR